MHQKHPKIKRPRLGKFAKTEFAFVGSTCERMEADMQSLQEQLSHAYRSAIITVDHGDTTHQPSRQVGRKQLFPNVDSWNEYDDKLIGSAYDLVLVNGNHFPAQRQIVYVDPQKAGTLERRKDQLTDIVAIVLCPGATKLPAWLQDHLGDDYIPYFSADEAKTELFSIIEVAAQATEPMVKALILAGGQSTRMGSDKASLVYRNQQAEAERLADYCESLGLTTFFSLREPTESYYGRPVVPDRFVGLGPMGAIASAFLSDPESAWLVLACDLPLLEREHIQLLLSYRDARQYATAVKGASQPFPEPLIAIYEPRAYARLLHFLSIGYACPRKLLINSDIAPVEFKNESPLTNANTPAERAAALAQLAKHG
ncbi:MAG: NTP transferase domain-containing protein [Bacteroidota bacterium]